jgi:sec-independent protein translocase protein TatA
MVATLLFMGLGMQELLFIALIVLLLFGGKRIPELMKGLGQGVKSFKDGMNGVDDSIKEEAKDSIKEGTKDSIKEGTKDSEKG